MGVKAIANISKMAMAVCALVAVPAMVEAGAKTKAEQNPAKRVCRVVTPTGSRLVERVCRTQEEWDYNEKKAQEGVLKSQIDDQVRPVPPAI
jgi:hypothetical protein